jgi:hypothetical protein
LRPARKTRRKIAPDERRVPIDAKFRGHTGANAPALRLRNVQRSNHLRKGVTRLEIRCPARSWARITGTASALSRESAASVNRVLKI